MQGKIAVEEHFAIPDTTDRSMRYQTEYWTGLQPRLLDLHDRRLAEMDAPASRSKSFRSIPTACRAFSIRKRPRRLPARPTTPWPKPSPSGRTGSPASPRCRCRTRKPPPRSWSAACAISNSRARWSTASPRSASADSAVYYDLPQYRPFWAVVERLGVPFYLHPRDPLPSAPAGLRGSPVADRLAVGICRRDRDARAAADGLGPVRCLPEVARS